MFGYVRPLKGELKVRELEHFKAVYCGLCRTLRKKYGYFAGFILNYDFTFLALLLSEVGEENSYEFHRCPAKPYAKKCMCAQNSAIELSADLSIVLMWWKLRDNIEDNPADIASRLLALFFKPAYKKAAGLRPEFNEATELSLKRLRIIEQEKSKSLDMAADTFATMLSMAVQGYEPRLQRPLEQLLYHVGRWIYMADALDDLPEDLSRGGYNPIAERFSLTKPQLDGETSRYLKATAEHSVSLAVSAFNLLPQGKNAAIIDNIISLGLPYVWKQISEGTWKKKRASSQIK